MAGRRTFRPQFAAGPADGTGQWFRHIAQDLLAQVARVPGEARAVAEASATTLRFAATHALSFTFMPGWLRGLESQVAIGPIQLVSDVQPRCEALLLQSQIHFILSYAHGRAHDPLRKAGYPTIRIGTDRSLPVSALDENGVPAYRFPATGKSAPTPVLGYSNESGLGRILHEIRGVALEKLPIQSVFTAHLASVLRTMVLDGRGLAWLPELLIRDDIASEKLKLVSADDWGVDLEIRLHRDPGPIGRAGEAFWDAAAAAVKTR